jgi:hypothetical protein
VCDDIVLVLCSTRDMSLAQGRPNTYYASIAKALASDVANKCATDAVQVRACVCVLTLMWLFV